VLAAGGARPAAGAPGDTAAPRAGHARAAPAQAAFRVYLPHAEGRDLLAVRVADRLAAMTGRVEEWDWEGGVAMSAAVASRALVGEPTADGRVAAWLDDALDEGRVRFGHPNHTVGAWAALSLWEHRRDPRYRGLVDQAVAFLENEAPRVDGALAHNEQQLWDDTLYMSVPLLAWYGVRFDRPDVLALAAREVRLHAVRLQDPATGLWYHGWDAATGSHMSGAFWARGNGWAALATTEVLRALPPDHPDREALAAGLRAQLIGLTRVQGRSGLWHTVVDRRDFPTETSGSAAITAALYRAIDDGVLPEAYRLFADAGRAAVLARVAADGTVTGVSAGTGVAPSIEVYAGIDASRIQPYGQGLVLVMLAAARADGRP